MMEMKYRTFQFALTIARLILDLPVNVINKPYTAQLIRSYSSVGANYRAARRAKSDADFINKLKIVEEEADESVYFPELLRECNPGVKDRINQLINEGTEILKIIVASMNTDRARQSQTNTWLMFKRVENHLPDILRTSKFVLYKQPHPTFL